MAAFLTGQLTRASKRERERERPTARSSFIRPEKNNPASSFSPSLPLPVRRSLGPHFNLAETLRKNGGKFQCCRLL